MMEEGSQAIAAALKSLGDDPDTASYSELTARWKKAGVGREAIEPVLRFMEEHPGWYFGEPGALVHFVERFNGPEYEQLVLDSFARRPTAHTAWMVNRLLNGTETEASRTRLADALREGLKHPSADAAVRDAIKLFLE